MSILIACCPACGQHLMNLGRHADSHPHPLKCTNHACPRPLAALEILADRETEHILVLGRDGGYSLKHPLRERLDNELLTCWVGQHVGEFGELMFSGDFGEWPLDVPMRVWPDGDGEDIALQGERVDGYGESVR